MMTADPQTEVTGRPSSFVRYHAVYQPIVAFTSGTLIGYEALLRGTRAGLAVTATEIFDVGDAPQRRIALDDLARQTALHDVDSGLGDALLFVNIEPATFAQHESWLPRLITFAKLSGVDAAHLVVEVTEVDPRRVGELETAADAVRAAGVSLSIDDFGSGVPELKMLMPLRPDWIKLDRGLVVEAATESWGSWIHALAETAGLEGCKLIGECVENAGLAGRLADLGVYAGQGWHFGAPLPWSERSR